MIHVMTTILVHALLICLVWLGVAGGSRASLFHRLEVAVVVLWRLIPITIVEKIEKYEGPEMCSS